MRVPAPTTDVASANQFVLLRRTLDATKVWLSVVLVVLTTLAAVGPATALSAASTPIVWLPTGSMATPRLGFTATLLPSGQVLVAGGQDAAGNSLTSAELYNPATGNWMATGSMHAHRAYQTATLLQSGQVLVAGGEDLSTSDIYTSSAELYDPSTGTWALTGNMTTERGFQTATRLDDGRVLIAGGVGTTYLASAELYDPATGTFTATGSMSASRYYDTATLLNDGRALVTGGLSSDANGSSTSSAELYDPATGSWTLTGSMAASRADHTATLLPNGQVLVVGGFVGRTTLDSAELYDPSTGMWLATAPPYTGRYLHTATLLPNGQVLVAGGYNGNTVLAASEVYDPATASWSVTGNMATARTGQTATLLPNGEVLAAGGDTCDGCPTASSELYTDTPAAMAIKPASGVYQQTIVLTGTDFGANEVVNIYADSASVPPVYSATTSIKGMFAIISTVRQGTYGAHALIAIGQTSGAQATTSFLIRPRLRVTPSAGRAGSTAVMTGYGFGANETVKLYWDKPLRLLGMAISNGLGTFSRGSAVTVTIPLLGAPGLHHIYGVGQMTHATTAVAFRVL